MEEFLFGLFAYFHPLLSLNFAITRRIFEFEINQWYFREGNHRKISENLANEIIHLQGNLFVLHRPPPPVFSEPRFSDAYPRNLNCTNIIQSYTLKIRTVLIRIEETLYRIRLVSKSKQIKSALNVVWRFFKSPNQWKTGGRYKIRDSDMA